MKRFTVTVDFEDTSPDEKWLIRVDHAVGAPYWMQVNKRWFDKQTKAEQQAILRHEFAHIVVTQQYEVAP